MKRNNHPSLAGGIRRDPRRPGVCRPARRPDGPIHPIARRLEDLRGADRSRRGAIPSAQVKLVLWCEAHGLGAERMKHLAMAVLVDPKNAAARGLLGLLDSNGRWETLERARERINADTARFGEPRRIRAATGQADRRRDPQPASAQIAWSKTASTRPLSSARLKDNRRLAQAHAEPGPLVRSQSGSSPRRPPTSRWPSTSTPIEIRPGSGSDIVKRDGRWTSPQQAAMRDRDEREQAQADHEWEPLLKKWKSWLLDKRRAAEAERLLATVTDRRALPSILRVFPADGPESRPAPPGPAPRPD